MVGISDVKNFISGYYNYFRNYLDNESLPKHVREQALYRAMLCSDCLQEGKCKVCKCATPAMFFAPKKKDSEQKWEEMLEAEEWEEFKQFNNITLLNSFEEIMFDEIRNRTTFEYLRPEMFTYRGKQVMNKMHPTFLLVLDLLFERFYLLTEYTPIITMSYAEVNQYSDGKQVVLKVSDEHLYQLIEIIHELKLSYSVNTWVSRPYKEFDTLTTYTLVRVRLEDTPKYLTND
jgi:hypothetical protein